MLRALAAVLGNSSKSGNNLLDQSKFSLPPIARSSCRRARVRLLMVLLVGAFVMSTRADAQTTYGTIV